MSTGYYLPETPGLLGGDLDHIVSVFVETWHPFTFKLDLSEAEVVFDETWSPHVQATIKIPAVTGWSYAWMMDPRRAVRIMIYAGYERPGIVDLQPVADLALRTVSIDRPSDTMTITASSNECLVQDFQLRNPGTHRPEPETVEALVRDCLRTRPGVNPVLRIDPALGGRSMWDYFPERPISNAGDNFLGILTDLADRQGAWFYSSGWEFHWIPRPTTPGAVEHIVTYGTTGTLIDSTTSRTREGDAWANQVALTYNWTDSSGQAQSVVGAAWYGDSATGIDNVGVKGFHETRAIPITKSLADDAAAALVTRLNGRGARTSFNAIAALWLRPGMTIAYELPGETQSKSLISRIDYDLIAGTMNVTVK